MTNLTAIKQRSVKILNDNSMIIFNIPEGSTPTDGIGSVFTKDKFGNWTDDNRTKK